MKAIIFLISFLVAAMQSHAARISDLDVGDVMYLQGTFSDELVMVIRIDARNNRVKIRRKSDMTTSWVHPSRLISREQSNKNDFGRTVVGIALFVCMLNPERCKEKGYRPPFRKKRRSVYLFKVNNKCRHGISLALRYKTTTGQWVSRGWWTFRGNSQRYLKFSDGRYPRTPEKSYYYYAYAVLPAGDQSALTNVSNRVIAWQGKYNYSVNGKVVPMRYIKASGRSDHYLELYCKGY